MGADFRNERRHCQLKYKRTCIERTRYQFTFTQLKLFLMAIRTYVGDVMHHIRDDSIEFRFE